MPLATFEGLGLESPLLTTMQLLIANLSIKRLVGILQDVLVKVDKFILSADFVILDCEVDTDMPIILKRPFFTTRRAVMDVERGDRRFSMNDEEVVFNICRTLKLSKDLQSCFSNQSIMVDLRIREIISCHDNN